MDVNYDAIVGEADTVQPIGNDLPGATMADKVAEPANEYDAIVGDMVNEEKQGLGQSLYAADMQEPDRKASVLKLAQQLNMPADIVDRNYDTLSKKKLTQTVDKDAILRNTPGLGKFLSTPDNATLAKDDLPNLEKIESHVNKLAAKPSDGFFGDIKRASSTGFNQLGASSYALAHAYGQISSEDAAEAISSYNKRSQELSTNMPDYATKFNESLSKESGDVVKAGQRFMGSFSEARQGHIIKALTDFAAGGGQTVGETLDLIVSAGSNPKGMGYVVLQNLAASSPGLITGAAGAAAGSPLGPIGTGAGFIGGSFAGEYATEVGAWVNQAMQDKGIDTTNKDQVLKALRDPKMMAEIRGQAERKGLGTASVSALFNLFGGVLAKGATGTLSKIARKAGDVAIQSAGETVSEGAGQLAAYEGDTSKVNYNDVLAEGILSIGHSMGETAISPIAQGASKFSESRRKELSIDPIEAATEQAEKLLKANRAQVDAKTLSDIAEVAKESKLNLRMPEKLKELIANIGETGEPKAVYFQPDEFDSYWNSKGKSPIKAAEQILGDNGEAYQKAKETGEAIKIPLENYIEKIATSEEDSNGLIEIARTDPDAMSLKESREEIKATPATMEELAKEVKEQSKVKDSSDEVKADVLNQLKSLGYSKSDADAIATLNKSVFQSFAKQSGKDALELYKQYGLQIQKPDGTVSADGQVFNQGKYNYDPETGEYSLNNVEANVSIRSDDQLNDLAKGLSDVVEGEALEINTLEVPFSEQGAGLGSQALKDIEQIARSEGQSYIVLKAEPLSSPKVGEANTANLPRLIDFYKKNGFKIHKKNKNNAIMYKEVGSSKTYAQSPTRQSPLGFYSKLEQTIEQKMGNSQPVDALRAMLKDMKPEEMKWSGLDEFLKGKEKVSKTEVLDFLRANQLDIKEVVKGENVAPDVTSDDVTDVIKHSDFWEVRFKNGAEIEVRKFDAEDEFSAVAAAVQMFNDDKDNYSGDLNDNTKFSQYTLPGGKNYREVLLTMPPSKVNETPAQAAKRLFGKDSFYDLTAAQQKQIAKEQSLQEPVDTYSSSHFDEKNILAHVRLNDRTDADGKKVLFVEEIQSDWHQAGRKKGYKGDVKVDPDLKALADEYDKIWSERKNIYSELRDGDIKSIGEERGNLSLKDFIKEDTREVAISGPRTVYRLDEFGESGDNLEVWYEPDNKIGKWSLYHNRGLTEKFKTKKDVEDHLSKIVVLANRLKEIQDKRKELVEKFNNLAQEKNVSVPKIGSFNDEAGGQRDMVPDAPFKKTWHEFAFKRILRMAAEQGYDRVAWTTGEQQAERYDLSKQIGSLEVVKNEDGTFGVAAYKDEAAHGRARNPLIEKTHISKDELSNTIGKELAERADKEIDPSSGTNFKKFSGLDLKVGGEGMKGFYDSILVKSAEKLVKKFGSKVGETKILGEGGLRPVYNEDVQAYILIDDSGNDLETEYKTFEDAEAAAFKAVGGGKVHSFDITPELRQAAVSEGFTLFQENRGQINLNDRSKVVISLFKNADPSTLLHEMGHFYLEVMGDVTSQEGSSEQSKADYQTLLNWFGVTSKDQIETKHHEQFARGFEAYLMEGKAPSSELRKIFAKFKVWLTSVYRQITNLDVQINDEVRAVFDRMVAAEAEVNKAEMDVGNKALFEDPTSIGMNEKQAAKYLEMREEARLASEDKVRAELMLYAKKAETAFYKEKKKELTAKITEQVNAMPIYKALDHLKGQVPEGSIPLKINKRFIHEQYDDKMEEALPKGITSNDGVHPDIVADMYGFESGDAMLTQMANLPSKKQFIDTLVKNQLEMSVPDPMVDGTISEEAVQAVHNDKREALLRFELEQMAKNDMPAFKDMTKRLIKRMPLAKTSRESAKNIISQTNVKDLQPHRFTQAERKQSGIAAKAWAAGDIEAAFEAKRKELLNFYLFQEATAAKQEVEKALKNFKKIAKPVEDLAKYRDTDMVNAARAVLSKYGLDKYGVTAQEHLSKIQQYDPGAYETIKAMVDSLSEGAMPYKQISFEKFTDLKDSVMAIWDLAKTSKEIEVNGKKILRDEAMNELAARIEELAPNAEKPGYKKALSKWDKVEMKALQMKAAMTRVEHWIFATDKDFKGPFRTYIFNPVMEGISKYRARKKDVIEKYKAHVEQYKDIFTKQPIKAEDLGYEFENMAHLMGAVLHSGNDSNLSKLLRGYGWGSRNEDGTLNRQAWDQQIAKFYKDGVITKRHMDFIQGVWDLFEEIKPELQAAHKEMQGYYFNEVTANEVVTPFGTYRGGYAPAKADTLIVEDAKIRSEIEQAESMNQSFNFPTSGKGSTMSRVEAYAAPLQLDMRLVGSHIDWAMRFAHIEPRVKEVNRIMLNKKFREKLALLDPNAASDMFVPWLQRIAQQSAVRPSQDSTGKVMDAVAGMLRNNVAMQVMTANIVNTAQQYTGVIVAASKVKPRHLKGALVKYIASPKDTSKFITESSKWMDQSQNNNVYEAQQAIEEILLNPSTFDSWKAFFKKHQYFLQTAAQNQVNSIVWMGAYNQSIENGVTHAQAVKEADSAVRLTQGSAAVEDISEFETGTQTARLFKQFIGYFNMLANLNGSEMVKISRTVGLKKGAGKAFYIYLTAFALPAILSTALVKAMAGKLDEDDDGEYLDDMLSVFFGSQLSTLTAMTPYVGTYVQTSLNQFNKQRYDDRLSLSPAISMLEATTSAPKSVYEAISGKANSEKKAIRDVLLLMGVATGLPLAPLSKPIGYGLDVRSGKAEPSGPIDFTRGLITGRPGAK